MDAIDRLRDRTDTLDGSFLNTAQSVVNSLASATAMRQWTLNRRSGDAFVALSCSPYAGGFNAGDRLPWGLTICGRMVDEGAPRVTGCVADSVYSDFEVYGIHAYMGVPLLDEAGRVVGTLSGTDGRKRTGLETFLPMAELFGALLGHALAGQSLLDNYARALGNATIEAETDPLTGLANRRGWERTLQAEQRRIDQHSNQAGVVIIDVDDLKAINDANGHSAGDQILCRTAEVIRQLKRTPDFAARIGGDEFGIIVGEITISELEELADQLRDALAEQGASASVGVAVTAGIHLQATVQEADAAMYAAKAQRTRRSA
jgi:diguanylate cyclase (GGDEF)-like protein